MLVGERVEPCADGTLRSCVVEVSHAGPMVGFGMEWRL
jgi:hypothetical protein